MQWNTHLYEPAKSLKKTHNQYCKQENIHTIISKEVESAAYAYYASYDGYNKA